MALAVTLETPRTTVNSRPHHPLQIYYQTCLQFVALAVTLETLLLQLNSKKTLIAGLNIKYKL